jgi:hypothetical protein
MFGGSSFWRDDCRKAVCLSMQNRSRNRTLMRHTHLTGEKMTSSFRRKIVGALLSASMAIALGSTSIAAESDPARQASGAALDTQSLDAKLTAIQQAFSALVRGKGDTDRDSIADGLEKQLSEYKGAMSVAYEQASKRAELAARTPADRRGFEMIATFERLAVRHEDALRVLNDQGSLIGRKLGYLEWPAARRLVPASYGVLDVIFPPANAAIAAGVSAICGATNVTVAACAAAVAAGVVATGNASATFNSCWASYEGTRPKWLRALRRAGCTAVYVAKLA